MEMLSLLSAAGYWVTGWLLFTGVKRLSAVFEREGCPSFSVVIPARNEAENLPHLLDSLSKQTQQPQEIIVVDDDSSDGTGDIAEQYGCRVVRLSSKPDEWTGKAWACWNGTAVATSSLIVFLDADVWCEPDFFKRLTSVWMQYGGLVSVQPTHITRKAYEQLSCFFNIVSVAAAGRKGSFGPCMICKRAEYMEIGGHEAVKDQVVDDVAMANVFHKRGKQVTPFMGNMLLKFRMYPGGIRDLWEGWTKNMATGASLSSVFSLILLIVWFTGIINCVLAVLFSVVGMEDYLLSTSLLLYGCYGVQIFFLARRVGRFSWTTAVFFPLYFLFFLLLFFASIILTVIAGKVRWKGRPIHLRH
jgi:4,4'-diaponeurosporenoate glycosyltransferase